MNSILGNYLLINIRIAGRSPVVENHPPTSFELQIQPQRQGQRREHVSEGILYAENDMLSMPESLKYDKWGDACSGGIL